MEAVKNKHVKFFFRNYFSEVKLDKVQFCFTTYLSIILQLEAEKIC